MRPVIETRITQHTIWQAMTGQIPPLNLPSTPVAHAVLDNRDASPGDLFVALMGENADGHDYIDAALQQGVQTVICEARGRDQLSQRGAILLDCVEKTALSSSLSSQLDKWLNERGSQPPIFAYIVANALTVLQQLGAFQRLHRCHPDLRVIGITGSVGKSTTKELIASVLRQRYRTLHSPGSLNNEQGLPFTQLGLGIEHERAVLEMGTYGIGEIRDLCTWARPHVGVVTNVGPVHLERLGSLERITEAKAELVQALPSANEGGVAILNWDDERVRSMATQTNARIFRYGLTPDADLWADNIESAGMEGIRFRFHYRPNPSQPVESLSLHVPLLGRHSVHTALRAAAVGLVEGLSWEEIVTGLQSLNGQIRLIVRPGVNGCTVVDDTYNASPDSTIAALNLLADLTPSKGGRRVAVLGDMLELGHYTDEGHKLVGRRAADVVDMLVTVGELGWDISQEAKKVGFDTSQLYTTSDHMQTVKLLKKQIRTGDLVLVKGSRAIGMDAVAEEIVEK